MHYANVKYNECFAFFIFSVIFAFAFYFFLSSSFFLSSAALGRGIFSNPTWVKTGLVGQCELNTRTVRQSNFIKVDNIKISLNSAIITL